MASLPMLHRWLASGCTCPNQCCGFSVIYFDLVGLCAKPDHSCNFWENYETDLQRNVAMGCTSMRCSLEWHRIEPERGQISSDAIAHFHKILDVMDKCVPSVAQLAAILLCGLRTLKKTCRLPSEIQLSALTLDLGCIACYVCATVNELAVCCRTRLGITPLATLHHFVHPQWFEDLGAFEKEENIPLYLTWVELAYRCARHLFQ